MWAELFEDLGTSVEAEFTGRPIESKYLSSVLCAWVFFLEARYHLAEMTVLVHEIRASTEDKEEEDMTDLLLEPKIYGFSTKEAAKEWMDNHRSEIAALKKLVI